MGFIKYVIENDKKYLQECFDLCTDLIKKAEATTRDRNDAVDFLEDARDYILNNAANATDRMHSTEILIDLIKRRYGDLKLQKDKLQGFNFTENTPGYLTPKSAAIEVIELYRSLLPIIEALDGFYSSNLFALRKQRPMEMDYYDSMYPRCPSCEKKITYNISFCPHCGQALMVED